MSNIRREKQLQQLKLKSLISSMGLTIDAQATSSSGRWKVFLGTHLREGLPCFDVLLVRTDFVSDVHHYWPGEGESGKVTYDEARDAAIKQARARYEKVVTLLQAKGGTEESEEDTGLKIVNPDGSEEKYKLN